MIDIVDQNPQLRSRLKVTIPFKDLAKKIKTSNNLSDIMKTAEIVLSEVKDIWQPAIVYQCLPFEHCAHKNQGNIVQHANKRLHFDFGEAFKYLMCAEYVFLSVYTAGNQLEQASSTSPKDLLRAYFIDLIGLAVLDKVGQMVSEIAEKKAAALGWGVGPVLSPGSVLGWELEDQINLCSVLPLEKINVSIKENAVLSPLKTLSSVIGIGPGYHYRHVGNSCRVCAVKNECRMRKQS